jgi:hypothetical protein
MLLKCCDRGWSILHLMTVCARRTEMLQVWRGATFYHADLAACLIVGDVCLFVQTKLVSSICVFSSCFFNGWGMMMKPTHTW